MFVGTADVYHEPSPESHCGMSPLPRAGETLDWRIGKLRKVLCAHLCIYARALAGYRNAAKGGG